MSTRPDTATIDARILDAEATAPPTVNGIFEVLPDAVAEAVRLDVAARNLGGTRSPEHDRVVGLCFALRGKLETEPLTTAGREAARGGIVCALMAIGYAPGTLLRWTRSDVRREPRFANPSDEMIVIPYVTGQDLKGDLNKLNRDPNFGRDVPPPTE